MRTWALWTARAAMFTASFVAAGAGTVGLASAGITTSGNNSIVGGNQISVPISVPVNACGNALAVLGDAFAGCQGGAEVGHHGHGHHHHHGTGGQKTSGNNSIGGGNQAKVPVKVPANLCGNSVAGLGTALSGCRGGAGAGGGGGDAWTSGNNSIVGGNQISVPVSVPVNACGNALAVLGDAFAGCQGGAEVGHHGHGRHHHHGTGGQRTSGNNSIGGGNQAKVPVKVPVNACGNSAGVLGTALSGCRGGAGTGGGGGAWTSGDNSIVGGNQAYVPVSIPINACGNALAVLGDAFGGCQGGAAVTHPSGLHGATSGDNSIIGGNQIAVPVSVPVNACGNAVGVLGDALAGCEGGAGVGGGGGAGAWTSGDNSIVGGNQAAVPVSVPANVCGNALAVLGDAFGGCKGGAAVLHTSAPHAATSGDNSIVGGNQAAVPVSVPANVCGNAATVLGDAFAGCAGGALTGGSPAMSSSSVDHMSAPVSSVTRSLGANDVIGRSGAQLPGGALAGLSSLPILSSLPTQAAQLTSYSSSDARSAQATLLSAQTAPGMGSGSLIALAMGALLAGAATVAAAGRRFSFRKASR